MMASKKEIPMSKLAPSSENESTVTAQKRRL